MTVYKLAERYGFPLLYRRVCEGIRSTVPEEGQVQVRSAIKASMRSPGKAFSLLNDSKVAAFLKTYAQFIIDKSPNVPQFMTTIAQALLKESGISKAWSFAVPGSSYGPKNPHKGEGI